MKRISLKKIIVPGTVAAMLHLAPAGLADNVHLGKDGASTEEIIQMLNPEPGNVKVRGLKLGDGANARPAQPKSISLEVFFEFDSARLSPQAIDQLAPLGEALRSAQLEQLDFELEGHTDALGDDDYNQDLSERRAASVRDYLIAQFGIAESRLISTGKGEQELLDPDNPNSGVNRRVRIATR
jgi:outer membrane protein OmpA-like peptidoglycan-associated protein